MTRTSPIHPCSTWLIGFTVLTTPIALPRPDAVLRSDFGESSNAGTGNPLTFRDERCAIAVTASGQILIPMAADMRALHLDDRTGAPV